MAKDLTTSAIERQNVLNNTVALPRIQEALDVKLLEFEGRYVLTKQMVADYYGVDERTIERLLVANDEELKHNGYFLCKGKALKDFKLRFASDINVAHKAVSLGLFDFRSFLNIGMLLTESEKAKYVRSRILDIVISTINEKTGGGTKYINRRDVLMEPIIYDARQKMASRDLAFRDVFHGNIAEYLKAVTPEEFDKFIGSKSLDFDAIMALPENPLQPLNPPLINR